MPVPDFQSFMLPILETVSDGNEYAKSDYQRLIADRLGLTEVEREELIPSGGQRQYENRIAWAVSHLVKAGLLERTGRARIRITERGRQALDSGIDRVDMRYLRQFSSYVEFLGASPAVNTQFADAIVSIATPEEQIASAYRDHRSALADELLARIGQANPAFFERLVIELLVAMGHGGTQTDAARATMA